jgi:hypothetical protein
LGTSNENSRNVIVELIRRDVDGLVRLTTSTLPIPCLACVFRQPPGWADDVETRSSHDRFVDAPGSAPFAADELRVRLDRLMSVLPDALNRA